MSEPSNNQITAKLSKNYSNIVSLFSGEGARAGYLAAADQSIISLSNFAATLILARNVSPTELGMYGVGFILLRLVRAIQEGITIQPLYAFGASMDQNKFREYATSTGIIQVLLALLSAAGALVLGWILILLGNDTAGPTLLALWSPFLWWQIQEFLRRSFYTRAGVLNAVINSTIANSVRLGMMIWLLNQGLLNGLSGLYAIGFGAMVAIVPGIYQTRSFWSRSFDNLKSTWVKNWSYGRWILGGTTGNWLAAEFYPILTAWLVSFAAAGVYRALQTLVAPVHVLLKAADTYLTPRAARAFQKSGVGELTGMLRKMFLVLAIPIIGILGMVLLFPERLLNLLYGDKYLLYSNAAVLMVIFYTLIFIYWPAQTALKATRTSRPIFVANLIAIFVMFTAGLGLVLRWGVYGTIAGQALNAFIIAIILWYSWIKLKRKIRI